MNRSIVDRRFWDVSVEDMGVDEFDHLQDSAESSRASSPETYDLRLQGSPSPSMLIDEFNFEEELDAVLNFDDHHIGGDPVMSSDSQSLMSDTGVDVVIPIPLSPKPCKPQPSSSHRNKTRNQLGSAGESILYVSVEDLKRKTRMDCVIESSSLSENYKALCQAINRFKSGGFTLDVLVGDTMLQWIENTFRFYMSTKTSTVQFSLADIEYAQLASRLQSTGAQDFWSVGSVAALGNCGYDSAWVCCIADGHHIQNASKGLRDLLVGLMERRFSRHKGLAKIYSPNYGGEGGVELCFLGAFQLVTTFAAVADSSARSGDEVDGLVTSNTSTDSIAYVNAVSLFKKYLVDARKSTTWLDEFTLIFLPQVLQRSVHVYSIALQKWVEYHPADISDEKPIYLLHLGNHYAPLITYETMENKLWERVKS